MKFEVLAYDGPFGNRVIETVESDDETMLQSYPARNYRRIEPLTIEQQKSLLFAQLEELDRVTMKPRTQRELALSNPAVLTWLAEQDAEAAILRAQLAALQA